MLEFDNVRLDLESFKEPLASLKDSLHIDTLSTKISELEARTQEPDFWNDVNKAQKLQTDLRRMQQRVENYDKLVADREDLLALCELANEDEDLTPVSFDRLIGRVERHIPLLGEITAHASSVLGKIYLFGTLMCGVLFHVLAKRLREVD